MSKDFDDMSKEELAQEVSELKERLEDVENEESFLDSINEVYGVEVNSFEDLEKLDRKVQKDIMEKVSNMVDSGAESMHELADKIREKYS